jgi:tripartite-type tricarboxylate transporter receptor subunit TctC
MKPIGVRWLMVLALAAGFTCAGRQGDAADYPTRPIRVVVPYAAGGADTFIRPLVSSLEKKHGITLVIETVVGAGGMIGVGQVKRSNPDGYTLLFCGSGALAIAPAMAKADYKIEDFSPILDLISIPYVLAIKKDAPYKTVQGLIEFARANPGKLTYGTPGVGSAPHLAMEEMAARLNVSITHVPFSGISTAVTSAMGGHIDAIMGAPNNVLPQVRSGNLIAIGISSRERCELAPEIPTLKEAGADVDVSTNFGFLAPKGTPGPIIERIANAVRDAASEPEFIDLMKGMQNRIRILSAKEFSAQLEAESAYFGPVIASLPKSR